MGRWPPMDAVQGRGLFIVHRGIKHPQICHDGDNFLPALVGHCANVQGCGGGALAPALGHYFLNTAGNLPAAHFRLVWFDPFMIRRGVVQTVLIEV